MLQSEASGLGLTSGHMLGHSQSNGSLSVSLNNSRFQGPQNTDWPVFLGIGLPFAPESPWYLVRKNRLEDAKNALRKLYGPNVDIMPKLAAIVRTSEDELELSASARWIDCFQGTNLVRTIISTGVFACQHLSGIVFVLGFSTYFFELAGLSDANAFDLGLGVTGCGIVGNLISWTVINTLGRRKTFVSGMLA